jgi:hypothetical protein
MPPTNPANLLMLEHVVRNSGNLLLASPSESDAAALRPHLQSVHLDHQRVLFEAGGEVTDIYFPTGAIVFLVAGLSTGEIIETTMVGKDGVVGGFAALGGIPVNQAIVQLAGPALTCEVSELRSAVHQSESLLTRLFRHEQAVYADKPIGCLHGSASNGGATLPMASSFERFSGD